MHPTGWENSSHRCLLWERRNEWGQGNTWKHFQVSTMWSHNQELWSLSLYTSKAETPIFVLLSLLTARLVGCWPCVGGILPDTGAHCAGCCWFWLWDKLLWTARVGSMGFLGLPHDWMSSLSALQVWGLYVTEWELGRARPCSQHHLSHSS